ncbi:MAG: DNA translocase FtsK, partial [Lachnospiraceae bacterium]|nr:DNA translocase FtsK [Lachnospiraceae bacterium]
EKLLGKGDMLYYPQGYTKPLRVQGAFVSDEEVNNVVEFIKSNNGVGTYDDSVTEHVAAMASAQTDNGGGGAGAVAINDIPPEDSLDSFFEAAGRIIIEKQKGSIGMLQRSFKVGFNRAARIMDQLEEAGVVGPEEGTKPRRVLMTMSDFENYIREGER